MVYIYILKLQNNKYYVGKTNNPKIRVDNHFNFSGSNWTKKNKPIQIEQIIPDCDDFDEDKYTIKYMEKYGINNVRGGSFCQDQLSDDNQKTINKMIKSSTDKCFNCGKTGHYTKDCKQKSENQNEMKWKCSYCEKLFDTKNGTTFHENIHCKVKKESDSKISNDTYMNEKCDCVSSYFSTHTRGKCLLNNISNYLPKNDEKEKVTKCYRCGRNGHWASKCYATKHVKGHFI